MSSDTPTVKKKQVINYYLYLVSKRDYTVQELVDKGLAKGFSGGEVKAAITQLKELNYLSDKRFVEVAVNSYKGVRGYYWIVQKLRRRKVPEHLIEAGLEDVDFSPNEEFRRKVENKYRVTDFGELEYKERAKIANYISRQGFQGAFNILKEWETGDDSRTSGFRL